MKKKIKTLQELHKKGELNDVNYEHAISTHGDIFSGLRMKSKEEILNNLNKKYDPETVKKLTGNP